MVSILDSASLYCSHCSARVAELTCTGKNIIKQFYPDQKKLAVLSPTLLQAQAVGSPLSAAMMSSTSPQLHSSVALISLECTICQKETFGVRRVICDIPIQVDQLDADDLLVQSKDSYLLTPSIGLSQNDVIELHSDVVLDGRHANFWMQYTTLCYASASAAALSMRAVTLLMSHTIETLRPMFPALRQADVTVSSVSVRAS